MVSAKSVSDKLVKERSAPVIYTNLSFTHDRVFLQFSSSRYMTRCGDCVSENGFACGGWPYDLAALAACTEKQRGGGRPGDDRSFTRWGGQCLLQLAPNGRIYQFSVFVTCDLHLGKHKASSLSSTWDFVSVRLCVVTIVQHVSYVPMHWPKCRMHGPSSGSW